MEITITNASNRLGLSQQGAGTTAGSAANRTDAVGGTARTPWRDGEPKSREALLRNTADRIGAYGKSALDSPEESSDRLSHEPLYRTLSRLTSGTSRGGNLSGARSRPPRKPPAHTTLQRRPNTDPSPGRTSTNAASGVPNDQTHRPCPTDCHVEAATFAFVER